MMKNTTTARERLIQATFELLERQGYHGTGLNQIIKESGAPKGSLYYYFPNGKEELVSRAIGEQGKALADRIRRALEGAQDPAEAVYSMMLHLAEKLEQSKCTKAGSFAAVALETSNTSEMLRETINKTYDAFISAIQGMLLAHGFSEARAVQIATLITASMEGAVVLCRTKKSTEPLRHIAQEMKHLLRSAIAENDAGS